MSDAEPNGAQSNGARSDRAGEPEPAAATSVAGEAGVDGFESDAGGAAATEMARSAATSSSAVAVAPPDPGRDSLLGLVDRLAGFLEHSELSELEIEVGGTALVMRKPMAMTAAVVAEHAAPAASAESTSVGADAAPSEPAEPARASVKAPLTGLFYSSPTPGSAPYVQVGGEVAVGQVIGLIEAMKLFNEIKSDLAGRVVRIVAEHGALVRAKQPLIEVDPL